MSKIGFSAIFRSKFWLNDVCLELFDTCVIETLQKGISKRNLKFSKSGRGPLIRSNYPNKSKNRSFLMTINCGYNTFNHRFH